VPSGNRLLKTKATGGAAKAKSDYDKILNTMYTALGRGVTTDRQLNRIGKKLFGRRWLGVYPVDVKPKTIMRKMNPGANYGIINVDGSGLPGSHWLSVCYDTKKDKWLIYDSFARKSTKLIPTFIKTIGYKYHDINTGADQPDHESSCGARSMAMLIHIAKHGSKSAANV